MTLLEAAEALRERKISVEELTRDALDRIAKLNPPLNAFITVTNNPALVQARHADTLISKREYRGALHGMPIAHKDCFATENILTTGGSKILAHRVPDHNAAIVTKLEQAAAISLGKTNLHELCYGITSTNPHFGAVRNPWDPERIPGGSSGGSAAAVAAGLVFAATGTDTGGSIRVPASFCGVVGLKPTYGTISRKGCLPLGITLDHIGPIARTVRDTAAMFSAMGGNAGALEYPDLRGLRVGVPENYFFDRVAPEVRESVRRSIQTIAGLGADVREVPIEGIEELNTLGREILSAEAASLWKQQLVARPKDFGDDVRGALERGCRIPAADYLEAQRVRRKIARQLANFWNGLDCVITPATPTTAPRIGDQVIEIGGVQEDVRAGSTRLVRPFNVLGWPALAMPCGASGAGLPIGVQLVAAPNQEGILFRVGAALEDALGIASHLPAIA